MEKHESAQREAEEKLLKEQEMLKEKEQKEKERKQQEENSIVEADWTAGPEALIKESLLIGDLACAVEVCLKCGRMAYALLLASGAQRSRSSSCHLHTG